MMADILTYALSIFVLIPLIISVNKTLYKNLTHEQRQEKGKVIQRILKTYALMQCTGWPCVLASFVILRMSTPVLTIHHSDLARYLVAGYRFFTAMLRDYVQFNSLIIAICRYTLIVYDTVLAEIRMEKIRRFYIICSVMVPLITTIMYETTVATEPFFISLFYGRNEAENYSSSPLRSNSTIAEIEYSSPIFVICRDKLPIDLRNGMLYFQNFLVAIIYSNIPEAFIYGHIFVFYQR